MLDRCRIAGHEVISLAFSTVALFGRQARVDSVVHANAIIGWMSSPQPVIAV